MGLAWISVTKYNIVEPIRHNAFGVHELPNSFQHGFEVVLLWFAAHHYVESFVYVLKKKTIEIEDF